jgi:dihydropyrimidinase
MALDRPRSASIVGETTSVLDLVVRNGRVVTPWGVGSWDVAVQGETIAAVAEPGTLTGDVGRVIDAAGMIVVPGGVEPHAHAGLPLPYPGARERRVNAEPPDVISKAAICGGTTTIVDFANWRPGLRLPEIIGEKDAVYRGHSYTDYTFHGVLVGMGTVGSTPERGVPVPLELIDEIPELIRSGFNTVKVWTTNATTKRPRQMMDFGHVWAVMEQVAAAGGVLAVHAEDEDIVMFMYRRLHAEGRIGTEHLHEAHSTLSEDLSFRRTIRLAERTGCAIYLMHVSAKDGVDAIAEARRKGAPVYGETLHHYASFTSDVYRTPTGPLYHTYPSLKGPEDGAALWRGLLDGGALSTVATDVLFCPQEIKLAGHTIEDTVGGNAATEERVGITYTEGVARRGMSLERFVDVTSANAARICGMYPRKGAVAPGSDADLALIDPTVDRPLRLDDLHAADHSVWEGWPIRGWPVMTILRGRVVYDHGKLLGSPSDGRLIGDRKTPPDVLRGPGGSWR